MNVIFLFYQDFLSLMLNSLQKLCNDFFTESILASLENPLPNYFSMYEKDKPVIFFWLQKIKAVGSMILESLIGVAETEGSCAPKISNMC